jgi:hypothetical protein
MRQNTSHAVMAQRFEPLDSLDDFPTPPWATRALCGYLVQAGHDLAPRPSAPSVVLQFAERVPIVKGRCDPKASTATSYAWVVWLPRAPAEATKFEWIPPCRPKLERLDDY